MKLFLILLFLIVSCSTLTQQEVKRLDRRFQLENVTKDR
jgi:hypothetical protein